MILFQSNSQSNNLKLNLTNFFGIYLRILLWSSEFHLALCGQRLLLTHKEFQRLHMPSLFFHSDWGQKGIPSIPQLYLGSLFSEAAMEEKGVGAEEGKTVSRILDTSFIRGEKQLTNPKPNMKTPCVHTSTLSATHSKFLLTICSASGVTSFRSR